MQSAIATAKQKFGQFVDVLQSGDGEKFAIKIAVTDNEVVEFVWLPDVVNENGTFKGKVRNEPTNVTNIHFGQSLGASEDEIVDWMFMRDGKMHGNFTMRPLLETLPEEVATAKRAILADSE